MLFAALGRHFRYNSTHVMNHRSCKLKKSVEIFFFCIEPIWGKTFPLRIVGGFKFRIPFPQPLFCRVVSTLQCSTTHELGILSWVMWKGVGELLYFWNLPFFFLKSSLRYFTSKKGGWKKPPPAALLFAVRSRCGCREGDPQLWTDRNEMHRQWGNKWSLSRSLDQNW